MKDGERKTEVCRLVSGSDSMSSMRPQGCQVLMVEVFIQTLSTVKKSVSSILLCASQRRRNGLATSLLCPGMEYSSHGKPTHGNAKMAWEIMI